MSNNDVNSEESGGIAFIAMMICIAYLLVACVILPLAITGFSSQPYALPVMGSALLLPFVHFFIFGGMALARKNRNK